MLFYLYTREYDDDDDGVVSLSIQLVPLLCLALAHTHTRLYMKKHGCVWWVIKLFAFGHE